MAEREVGDEEFLDVAKDPARARALRKSLKRLAEDDRGGALQEMAREVLAGRIGLREAVSNTAYREALSERARSGFQALGEMSEADRRAAEEEGRRQLDAYQREIDEERRRQREDGRSGRSNPRHDGRGWRL